MGGDEERPAYDAGRKPHWGKFHGPCRRHAAHLSPGPGAAPRRPSERRCSGGGPSSSGATGTTIDGLVLGSTSAFSFGSTKDMAVLLAIDGAAVTVTSAEIENSPLLGVLAARSSKVEITSSTISHNTCSDATSLQIVEIALDEPNLTSLANSTNRRTSADRSILMTYHLKAPH